MVRTSKSNRWVVTHKANPSALLRLFCFPYAGGNASIFRSWHQSLPEHVEVCAVQLPGRVNRALEPPVTKLKTVVSEIGNGLGTFLDKPLVFFGHSLGAIVSFELSRWLRSQRGILPAHLFVSGRRAPHIPVTDPPDYEKSDEDFIAKLRELKGTPEELLDNDELLRFMLPVLRADFELAQTYQYYEEFPLSCPITAFGATDDEESQDGRLDGWRIHSTKRFGRHILDGDHFFLHSAQDRLLTILGMELSRVVRFRT